jgi:WD40 repeat protein/DNA replication protein DnaC
MDEGHDEAVKAFADPGHHGLCTESQYRWFADRLDTSEFTGWLRIGAVHHNILRGCRQDNENLRDADLLESILGHLLPFVLHGHTHYAKTNRLDQLLVSSTGSASLKTHGADVVPADVPNQYQVLTIRPNSLTRHGRRFNTADSPPRWIADTSISENGDGSVVVDADFRAEAPLALPDEEANDDDLRIQVYPKYRPVGLDSADLLFGQVCRLAKLRHTNSEIQPLQWQRNQLRCFHLTYLSESGVGEMRPVVTSIDCPTPEDLETLRDEVVLKYRAGSSRVYADCICGDQSDFSKGILTKAEECYIRLQRLGEYRGLIDLTSFIAGQTTRIEELQRVAGYRTDWYVNQRMTCEYSGKLSTIDDALTEVARWMERPDPTFVLLLGEPGTGKTFLILELARRLAKDPCMRPILVELRRMEKSRSVASMLGALFAEHQQASDPNKLTHMINQGAVTLLVDGFDELALRVGYARAADHLKEIIEAAQGESPHIIVTSRASHFESDKQVRNKLAEALAQGVRGMRYCHLLPFEAEQIEEYLRKRFGDESDDWMKLLRDVEDLIGLSRIPRMLSFITSVPRDKLEEARKPQTGTVSAGDVYRLVIVEHWLPYEYNRMNQPGSAELLTREQLLDAVRVLAQALWRTTDKFISLEELSEQAQGILKRFAPEKVGQEVYATHQLGSGTLLMRDAEGRFTFIHQSIMEWLIAEQAARQVQTTGDTDVLHQNEMTSLMADFFIDLAGRDKARDWTIAVQSDRVESDRRDRNKSNRLVVSRRLIQRYGDQTYVSVVEHLANEDLSGRDLSGQDFSGAIMDGAQLFDADLSGADLSRASLVGSDLRNANLRRAILEKANLTGADLTGADLCEARMIGADLTNANLTRVTLIKADLRGTLITGSQWKMTRLVGALVDDSSLSGPVSSFHPTALLPGASGVKCVAWSPDKDLLVSGHTNGIVGLWDVVTGKQLWSFEGHTDVVSSVAFRPDGKRVASGSHDNTLRMWDVSAGKLLLTVKGHTHVVNSVAFSPDGTLVASGSHDKTLRLWDALTGLSLHIFSGHSRAVNSVAFSPDGSRVASGSNDKRLRVWDASTGKSLRIFKGHTDFVNSVAFSPDGSCVASGSNDNTLRVWDATTGRSLRIFKGHTDFVNSVAFSPDGSSVASGSYDDTLRVWDASTGRSRRIFKGHTSSVNGELVQRTCWLPPYSFEIVDSPSVSVVPLAKVLIRKPSVQQ